MIFKQISLLFRCETSFLRRFDMKNINSHLKSSPIARICYLGGTKALRHKEATIGHRLLYVKCHLLRKQTQNGREDLVLHQLILNI